MDPENGDEEKDDETTKKRPAAKTVRVTNPHYYSSSNSWGLKIGSKQVISVSWSAAALFLTSYI